ncbi:MAG: hypothetical protein A3H01_00095 [Candidatus Wildermuthbacteria bacterium RIFCSPLOWO2_12_FULL_40_9]|uniref:EfeO-type cupredoxin-like domain-containing protein n=2 Tax=Candidatus Wildermuthiibacteriota TaxID=1817923 RepID=A0A1G2REL0_9BACT|nr:MAG: hypothetical protein A3F15_01460 [Candidatus Wildermuthbacteria bacterium RIFCSPHIGHO2_12_FULL_40_12]OHA76145.1 MAG: hypothetical protein A3H01_00095 [Candidatus Wildermuthbacteria bacterium RIFCSPLOWO2_12_FULL_40_9]
MKNKILILAIAAIVIVGIAIWLNNSGQSPTNTYYGEPGQGGAQDVVENDEGVITPTVKEFTMESFVEFIDGNPKPQFSIKEIVVNKGDRVKINITTTSGKHDFKLDEFNIYEETPVNQQVAIEFVADQSGEFIYYCNQPGHRLAGQWGTLKVIE